MGYIISLFIALGKPWKNICGIKIMSHQPMYCLDHTSCKDIKSVLMNISKTRRDGGRFVINMSGNAM